MDRMYEQNQMPHNNEAEQSVLGSNYYRSRID